MLVNAGKCRPSNRDENPQIFIMEWLLPFQNLIDFGVRERLKEDT